MAEYITKLPIPKLVTLKEILRVLPDTVPYPFNFSVGGKLARYGQTSENIIFLIDSKEEPSSEMKTYFSSLVEPIGLVATVSQHFRDERQHASRLYNEGRLILDRETGRYTEIPSVSVLPPILTVQEFISKCPKTIPWTQTLYLTGSLALHGWSGKDADIITFDPIDRDSLALLRKEISDAVGWKVDTGVRIMPEREPPQIKLIKLYENGNLCLPQ